MTRVTVLTIAVAVMAIVLEAMRPTLAMPPFAQSYGVNCELCHSAIPGLNAYGRYVQRTGYASLDFATIHRASPIWIGEAGTYSTTDGTPNHKIQAGNFALHAVGFFGPDITFHMQQFLYSGGQLGGTDTFWLTYNNLLHRDGHLFVGKIQSPAPSPYGQFFDLSAFATPEIAVGEHVYADDGNRWGAKFSYVKPTYIVEGAYLANHGDFNTATDFSSDTDKTFQWRIAFARPDKPVEIGILGNSGSLLVSDGMYDKYTSETLYTQVDPQNGLPGFLGLYKRGHDSHPGAAMNATNSSAYTTEVFEPLFNSRVMLVARDEVTNDGMGAVGHSGNLDAEWVVFRDTNDRQAQGLMLNGEAGLSHGSMPAWRMQLWWTTTIGHLH